MPDTLFGSADLSSPVGRDAKKRMCDPVTGHGGNLWIARHYATVGPRLRHSGGHCRVDVAAAPLLCQLDARRQSAPHRDGWGADSTEIMLDRVVELSRTYMSFPMLRRK